ncbi:right-handed parallel beta-helix repeat-containing protein, partial [bacterium]|nr:right-handed parallel beta-helix repeat-containing protein [bacterium]
MGYLLKVCIFVICALIVSPVTFAAVYYIDAINGNNAFSGTSADNVGNGVDGPWKTLSRLSQQALVGGDSVLLHCDNQWNEMLDLDLLGSGTTFGSDTITFGSYGTSCISKPRIQGADLVTGWVLDSSDPTGKTYYSDNISTPIYQLLADGEFLRPAQHPSFGYYSIDQNSTGTDGKQYLIDADQLLVPTGESIVNANVFIRTRHWEIEERQVTSYDNLTGEIRWENNTEFDIQEGFGYYLSGLQWMLDEHGEWYQDSDTLRLWVRTFNGDTPENYKIQASVREYGIVNPRVRTIDDIKITGIEIANPGTAGILLFDSVQVEISDVDIVNSGGQGIYLKNYGTDSSQELNTSVVNCKISNTVREGIWLKNHDNTVVDGNVVTNAGTIGAPVKTLAAILAEHGSIISNNIVRNTGYLGIFFYRNSIVKNNHVIDACTVLDDCGGIYTWHRPIINSVYATKDQYTSDDEYHSSVIDNIVEGATGM